MVIIIGAGISGLTVAQQLPGDVRILEKENYIGGLSTQYWSQGHWFDFGGHYFHFLNKADIQSYVTRFCPFEEYQRKSLVFLLERFLPYPIQVHLSFLPRIWKNRIAREILSPIGTQPENLAQFLISVFGPSLFQLFFEPFLSKYYRFDLEQMSSDMDKGSIPVPDPDKIREGLRGKNFLHVGYNPVFYYPRQSLRDFIFRYAQGLETKISLQEEILEVDLIKKAVYTPRGSYPYDFLINTMPLKKFLCLIRPAISSPNPDSLLHTSTLVVNTILKRRRKRFHWVYLAERQFPFYRVGFYPGQKAPVCYLEGNAQDFDLTNPDIIFRQVKSTLLALNLIHSVDEIKLIDFKPIPISYIIFNKQWKQTVPPLLNQLRQWDIFSIGRFGAWNYSSMSDDIQNALAAADTINTLSRTKL